MCVPINTPKMEENLKVGFCEGSGGSKVLQLLGVYWISGGQQESFTPCCLLQSDAFLEVGLYMLCEALVIFLCSGLLGCMDMDQHIKFTCREINSMVPRLSLAPSVGPFPTLFASNKILSHQSSVGTRSYIVYSIRLLPFD